MQSFRFDLELTGLLAAAALAVACSSSAPPMSYDEQAASEGDPSEFRLFTNEPRLYAAALRSVQRIEAAIGPSGLSVAEPEVAARCSPFQAHCGFELSSAEMVYCLGDPDPALACTSFAGAGKTIGIEMQADLAGDELENRLIHEFFHAITLDRAPHSVDGLFMQYSLGSERISRSTLESVCEHFPCENFVVEVDSSAVLQH